MCQYSLNQFLYVDETPAFGIVCTGIETTWTAERATLEPDDRPQSRAVSPAGWLKRVNAYFRRSHGFNS